MITDDHSVVKAILAQSPNAPPDDDDGPTADSPDAGLQAAAEDILGAVEAKSPERLVSALRAAFEMLQTPDAGPGEVS